jgi:hypothetical protein
MACDDWICLKLLRYELETIRRALSIAAQESPGTRFGAAQALGMLDFAQKRAEATTRAAGIALRGDELDAVLPDISNEEAT